MPDRRETFRGIGARARTLTERLASTRPIPTDADREVVRGRLERWQASATGEDRHLFEKRLAWDGLTVEDAGAVLADAVPKGFDAPAWTRTLEEIVDEAANAALAAPNSTTQRPLPFDDVWRPAVAVASRRLESSEPARRLREQGLVAPEAWAALERSLLGQLVGLAAPALYEEFSKRRPFGRGAVALLLPDAPPSGETQLYREFVDGLLADGLLGFYESFPALARLAVTMIENWVESGAEFFDRLERDRSALAERLEVRGRVEGLEPWLSDPHGRGRTVFGVTFENGCRVMYKPRDISLEARFQELLGWCNAGGLVPTLRPLAVLDRGGYGWVEAAAPDACPDADSIARCYRRAGMLLALTHALRGTDCHRENLMASGEQFLLIDAETLLHHDERPMEAEPEAAAAETAVQREFADSVLRTGMLPRWEFDARRRVAYDATGLGSFEEQSVPRMGLEWKSVNTDDMTPVPAPAALPILPNVPHCDGMPAAASDHLEEILAGFAEAYRFLLEHRDAFLAAGGPLENLARCPARFLFRATQVYSSLLQQSLEPPLLRDGVERSLALEALSRAYLFAAERPDAWPILGFERRALERLDIPLFGGRADEKALSVGVEPPIPGYFREPSAEAARDALSRFSEEDLARQTSIIRIAFRARAARPASSRAELPDEAGAASLPEPLGRQDLLAAAEEIAASIAASAIRGADGSATWIDIAYVPGAERFQLQPLGLSLYDGRAGIGLFFAAWSRVSGDRRARSLALSTLAPARASALEGRAGSPERLARQLGPGGLTGVGSLAYALALSGRLLDDEDLLAEAGRLSRLLDPALHPEERRCEILSGAAGAALALLALSEQGVGNGTGLRLARDWGQRLLDGTAREISGKTSDEPRLTGFSHGAAGVGYALLRLSAATGESRFREAASEAIAWENGLFCEDASNWPDLRPEVARNGERAFMASWCHGAAGIGLARAAGLSIDDSPAARRDVLRAIEGALRHRGRGSDVDHLCCGTFGRVELGLVAAERLGRPDLLEAAGRLAAARVEAARSSGGYRFDSGPSPDAASPSFFRGLSGIGWQLLRLADPSALPAVTLLEAR